MHDLQAGDYVLDTDGAHWVPAIVDASAVADPGHGEPHGPRGTETDAERAYDASPYPAPDGYRTAPKRWTAPDGYREIADPPFIIREP